ncbi:MAG: hypothetical protein JST28_22705 [Acidobacteria bacterium]|nr:hypothetical protein [Acidobacteriota bacterium]
MKSAIAVAAVATLTASAASQSTLSPTQLLRTQTAFDLTVNLPYAEAAPLFGPEGERAWAGKHWDPKFLYPRPARDEQGSVFTIQHGSVTATWVNALFDLEGRHFIYAYFMPGIMVTTIDVRFTPADTTTKVRVVYARTALTPEGNEHVTALTVNDRAAAHDWQQAIDAYLVSRQH